MRCGYSTNGWMPTGTSTEAMQWPRRLVDRSNAGTPGAAASNGRTLLTRDRRAERTYRALAVEYRFVD